MNCSWVRRLLGLGNSAVLDFTSGSRADGLTESAGQALYDKPKAEEKECKRVYVGSENTQKNSPDSESIEASQKGGTEYASAPRSFIEGSAKNAIQ
jgi:hypothetical protein